MIRRQIFSLGLCLVLAQTGCSDSETDPDTGTKADGSTPDVALPDATLPDQLLPDQLLPDQLVPDLYVHDQYVHDQYVHDQYVHDQYVHDQYVHDQYVHDQYVHDTAVVVDAVTPPTDGITTGDTGTTGGPYVINKGERGTAVTCQHNRSMVRNAIGELFYCYRAGVAPFDLNISRSINGGLTWTVWAKKVNTETYAYNISGCTLAVDKNSNIYAVWHRYSYSPAKHGTYLRKYDPNAGKWGTQKTIREYNVKSSTSSLAVDSKGYVYVLSGYSSSWRYHLWKSKTPYASTMTFTDLGDPSSYSYSQTGVMTIDSKDNVHVLFYGVTSSTGVIFHRYYSGAWKTATPISNVAKPNDKPGPMAADGQGNVHITYVDGGGDSKATHVFQYRKWSAAGTMGKPITLLTHTATQHGNQTISNPYIHNIAANEATGDVYVVTRNMNEGGAFVLYKKTPTATTFTKTKVLGAANTGKHYYYMPRLRGTVYPSFNQTGKLLDIAWIQDASSTTNANSMFLRLAAP